MKSIQKLMSLKGRRALITGANGHIGQRIASTIAELGGDLVLVDKPEVGYGGMLERLRDSFNIEVTVMTCDLENENSREELITDLLQQKEPLNIVVNNAAMVGSLIGASAELKDESVDTWRRIVEVNLTAPFHLSKGLALKLKQSEHGTIINIASIYGVLGPNYSLYEGTEMGNPPAYAASKGGLIQLTRWLATTVAPHVRVNSVSPGGIERGQPESFKERYIRNTPLDRMGNEDDLKGVIAYLASDMSSYVTGHNIMVDGGLSAK